MTKTFNVVSAGTAYPNTEFSDAQNRVPHDVLIQFKDGEAGFLRVLASDPADAIWYVNRWTDEAAKKFLRKEEVMA